MYEMTKYIYLTISIRLPDTGSTSQQPAPLRCGTRQYREETTMQTRPGAHPRRLLARLLAPLLGSALLAFVAPALSDTPAGGTIRIVVGAPPGGAPDTVARIVAQH